MLWLCVAFMRVAPSAPSHPSCLLSSPEQYDRFLETSRKFTRSQKALKRVGCSSPKITSEEVLQMKGLNQFYTSSGSFCSKNTAQVGKGLFGLMWFVVLDSKRFHTWPPGRTNQKPRANHRPSLTSLFHNIEKSSAGFSSLQLDPCDSVFVLAHKHYITLSWVRWTSPAFRSLSCCCCVDEKWRIISLNLLPPCACLKHTHICSGT